MHGDPDRVLALLDADPGAGLLTTVYRGSVHRHRGASAAVRRQVLALGAAQFGDRELAGRLAAVTVDGDAGEAGGWIPVWATGALADQRLRQCLTGHTDEVSAVATTVVDGRPVAVTGSADTTVRVWDLTTGSPVGAPLTGHAGQVAGVATAMLDGRAVAVVGSRDGAVRVWDLGTGRQIGPSLEGISPRVPATAVVDGRAVALTVSAADDESVRVWDLGTGEIVGASLEGHTGSVYAMTTAEIDGRPIAVTGGYYPDSTIRLWDLATGQPVGPALDPGAASDYIDAVATAVVGGRPVVVAITGFNEGTSMQMLDPGTGRTVGRPMHTRDYAAGIDTNTCAMTCVATAVVDGRPVAVTGCDDGTVQVWDLTAGRSAEPSAEDHAHEVTAVATAVVDDRPVAVTSTWSTDADGTVNIWDLATGRPVGKPLHGHYSPVHAVATAVVDGRPVAVSLGHDPTVVVWDLTTGQPATQPSKDDIWCTDVVATTALHGRPVAVTGDRNGLQMWDLGTGDFSGPFDRCEVASVATAVVDGRPVVVAGGRDGAVRVWDLATRRPVGEPFTGHAGGVNAVATGVVDGCAVAVIGSGDKTVRVWNLVTGQPVGEPFTGCTGRVNAVATGVVDGRPVFVAGNVDGAVHIRVLTTGRQAGPELLLPGSVNALAVTSDGRLVVCFDRDIAVLTVRAGAAAVAGLGCRPVRGAGVVGEDHRRGRRPR
ncbi:WD40 repeat domain-containing protein [Streptomyces sp. NPDC002623]